MDDVNNSGAELDNGKDPNPSIQYINVLGIDSVHKVPKNAYVTNVRRHITKEGNKCGYNFDYHGETHYVYYPWALVEDTWQNRVMLMEIEQLELKAEELKAKLKSCRASLADLRN